VVSKDFDSTLSDAIDRAAGAANTAGATAARIRGRERTLRKRVVISTTSIVLVAAGAGAAFSVSSHNGGTPHPTVASPSVSASPSTGASTSPSASGTPTTSASGAQSTTASPSTPTSSSSTTSITTGVEVWLTPSQLIYDSTMKWQAASPTSCTAGSFEITSLYPGGCSEHTNSGDPYPAEQMDTRVFSAPGVATGNGAWAGTTADQEFYSYANAADAQSAYQYFTHAFLTEDSQFAGSSDAITHLAVTSTTTETAQASGAMAIDSKLRTSSGKPASLEGNPSEASDRHYFFAVRGDIVEMILVKGGPAVSDTSNDASFLQTVINALS
jgi:hypothetical protein